MINKINVSVLGATGMVGQNYLRLLNDHPWFNVIDVAASHRSAGKKYSEIVQDKWYMPEDIPSSVSQLIIRDSQDFGSIPKSISCIFSAMDLPEKKDTKALEFKYASAGFPVISNNSANRLTPDVPMIIPEINSHHSDVIPLQQKNRNFPKTGFVAVKPNCSIQSYLVTLTAMEEAGFPIKDVLVTTLQALSGAGIKGITSLEMQNNVIPFIKGEEEKTQTEPLKILGQITNDGIKHADNPKISAVCTRVPVVDGHTAVVHINFKKSKPDIEKIASIWSEFRGEPQIMNLPSAPHFPIIYLDDKKRPQPKLDKDVENGMAVSVGRLEKNKIFDVRFISLSHNIVRGAAGGAILMAELLVKQGYIHDNRFN